MIPSSTIRPTNILVVDHEPELRGQLRQALCQQHYRVETAADGEQALAKLWGDTYDLVLLDVMMPGLDGLAVLREIRGAGLNLPVLMLTARGGLDDRVQGLDLGADDYLAKPFAMAELLSRIRSLLRRGGERDPVLAAGNIRVDTVGRLAAVAGRPLLLTAKEFSILEFLLYNKGRAVSRFNLAEHVWGDDFDPFTMSNFIDVHMKNLRRKIIDADGGLLFASAMTHYVDIPLAGNRGENYTVEKTITRELINLGQDEYDGMAFRAGIIKGQLDGIPCIVAIAKPIEDLEEGLDELLREVGAGLATCTLLAELHGDSIRLTSMPGKWTRVTVSLPAAGA